MAKFKCPHCNKEIELSEVTKKQADHLAAQEIQKFNTLLGIYLKYNNHN